MILTGKAKEYFEKWYFQVSKLDQIQEYEYKNLYEELGTTCLNALIIDWFISNKVWDNVFYNEYRKTGFKNYALATTESIKKANKIYNNKI